MATELLKAIQAEELTAVTKLLYCSDGDDLNRRDPVITIEFFRIKACSNPKYFLIQHGYTPLMLAAESSNVELMRLLHGRGVELLAVDEVRVCNNEYFRSLKIN